MPDDASRSPAVAGDKVRRARLFRNGRSQAVRIPREMELQGEEVDIHREGERIIIEPVRKMTLLEVLATMEPIEDEFDFGEDLPAEPVDL